MTERCSLKNCWIAGMRKSKKINDAQKAEFDEAVAQGAFLNHLYAFSA